MPDPSPNQNKVQYLAGIARQNRAVAVKAISFALIGVVNAGVNYACFLLGLQALGALPSLGALVKAGADACGCVSTENAGVIAVNIFAWMVAVSGSYVMNSLVTFAAESGRKLTWRAYVVFAASGLLGLLADTTTLLLVKNLLPIELAKIAAIGAGFIVNFSMSHFVVFRPK